ncbi:uncharacterized protein DS421_3g102380 [Arachis hypogaea]|nr:uncharacterized protein DS421_3g102380 [Arachis hypogaea]
MSSDTPAFCFIASSKLFPQLHQQTTHSLFVSLLTWYHDLKNHIRVFLHCLCVSSSMGDLTQLKQVESGDALCTKNVCLVKDQHKFGYEDSTPESDTTNRGYAILAVTLHKLQRNVEFCIYIYCHIFYTI